MQLLILVLLFLAGGILLTVLGAVVVIKSMRKNYKTIEKSGSGK